MKRIATLILLAASLSGYAQNRDSLVHEADLRFDRKEYATSARLLQQAIDLDKNNPGNYLLYSDMGTSYWRIKQLKEALDAYNKAIAINPGDARLYNNRASLKRVLNDLEGSAADYSRSLSLDPKDEDALLNRAYVKKLQKDISGSKQDLITLLKYNPKNYRARSNFAVLKLADKDFEGALKDFQEILVDHPDDAILHNNIADAYLNLKLYDKGLAAADKAVQADPGYDLAYLTRAELLLAEKGNKKQALTDLNKAVSLGYDKSRIKHLFDQCKE